MAIIKKITQMTASLRCGEIEPSYVGRNVNGTYTLESSLKSPQMTKHMITAGPSNSTLRNIPKRHKNTHLHKN